MSRPRRAIVLSGGGARGAYEAGVMRYVMETLPQELGHPVRFEVLCGTSVGAINSAWLAATLDEPAYSVQRLWYLWRTLEFRQVVQPAIGNLWGFARNFLGLDSKNSGEPENRGGVLRADYFRHILQEELPIDNIQRNLGRGLLDALTVSTTNIVTGQTTTFVQTAAEELPPWTRDPARVAIEGAITPDKILASAAIPFVFAPVKIGNHWFCDGGLRQNTPLSPALRLDADRVLVISLQSGANTPRPHPFSESPDAIDHRFPDTAMMLGKLLDAVLLDPIEYDLSVLKRINAILRYSGDLPGEDEGLNEIVGAYRGQGYRVVEPLLLQPSEDLGRLARDFALRVPDSFWGSRMMAAICKNAATREYDDSDLLSYLLFDGGYTGQLLEMGYRDAEANHAPLIRFFQD